MSHGISLQTVWTRRHWYLRRWKRPGPPWFVNIEPTNACNLRCTVCSHDGSRPSGFMDVSLCRSLVRQAVDLGVTEARFFLAGEPLLHPRLPQLIRIARDGGLRTCIHTNATRLDDRKALALLASGLDFMSISVDGENAEAYESVQVGARFEETILRIRRFLEVRDRYRRGPTTVVQVIKGYRAGEKLSVDKRFSGLFRSHPPDRYVVLYPHSWAGDKTDLTAPPKPRWYHPCLPLWEGLSVYWDGRVPLCCGDLNGRSVIADATAEPLHDIWYGATLTRAREALVASPPAAGRCRECDAIWHRTHPLVRDLRALARLP